MDLKVSGAYDEGYRKTDEHTVSDRQTEKKETNRQTDRQTRKKGVNYLGTNDVVSHEECEYL